MTIQEVINKTTGSYIYINVKINFITIQGVSKKTQPLQIQINQTYCSNLTALIPRQINMRKPISTEYFLKL